MEWAVRIVSLLSSATETLFGLGIGEQVVAVSHECDYPAGALSRPRATRSLIDSKRYSEEIDAQVKARLAAGAPLYEIDRELVRRLAPDLIVTQAQCDVCAVRYQDVVDFVAAEPSLALTQVLALNPSSLSEILRDCYRVGEAAQQPDAARGYCRQLTDRVARIAKRTGAAWPGSTIDSTKSDFSTRPRVVCLEWTVPLMAAGNWTPELIHIAGGVSCLAEPGQHSDYVSWQDVQNADPDVLIIAPCGFGLDRSQVEAKRLTTQPEFHGLRAFALRRAFVVDGNAYLNRSGPRIVDSVEILANLIRPDCCEPPLGELAEGRAWNRLSV